MPGSGKSNFASRLALQINAGHVNSDRVRKKTLAERSYSWEERLLVYEEMLSFMKQAIKENKNLVLDATFYKHDIRKRFIDEAWKSGAIIFFIEIQATL